MKADIFAKQVEAIYGRVHQLYQNANSTTPSSKSDLLGIAFKELGTASEELQVAVEELSEQVEELSATRVQLEAERQRYQDLFEFAPDAYLVTDAHGKICEANRAAGTLLNISPNHLIGKPAIVFIAEQERWAFRSELNRQRQKDKVQELEVRLQPRDGELFEAALRVVPVVDAQGNPTSLRWLLRDISEQKRALEALENSDYYHSSDRTSYVYARGEIIPLNLQTIWLVSEGLVKLSTINENGQEVFVGLAGPDMIFGSNLTWLYTYQATALSRNVRLVSIPLSEIAASPRLAQILFAKISLRLKQTESLLAISGQKRVKDRLYHLLLLLQQQIGEPVPEGTRLSVRLTHEDLATACCATRVTITRLLSKLQEQGKVSFDSKCHMILKNMSL